jgi:L-fucose isomerase-like protein
MLTSGINDIIASVNYRGDFNQSFPQDHNERYTRNLKELLGVEIVRVAAEEFYELFRTMDIKKAEETAEGWINGARWVEASRAEIIKSARAYLAIDALREKYNCNAVSTHIRSVTGSRKLEDRFNPGIGLELGFKTRGIQAVCQNYPDILISQVLAYLLTGRPSMLGDVIYDIDNSVEIVLHCGIPINPYGDERRIPYTIRTHAESPVRDRPEEPGSSTGLTAEWPVGEPVTFWEIHSLNKTIRLHTGEVVNGHAIYTGGEDIDNVMCTAKVIAMLHAKRIRDRHVPYLYGIHTNATLGDLRRQIKDIAVLLGFDVIESDT